MRLFGWLRRVPLALVILVVGVLGFMALLNLKPRPEPRPDPEPSRPGVQVERVQLETRALTVEAQGTVTPRRDIQLVSQVGGQIIESAPQFVAGGRFQRGDWLVRLDPRDYKNALAQAEAQLREAERVLAEERGRARQAEREWRDLGNADANALFLRQPQIAAAEAAVDSARAARDQAQLDLERTEVRAPFAGRIRQTMADQGQFIGPGTSVADIYEDTLAQVRLPLTDAQAALLKLPFGDELSAEAQPSVTLHGRALGEDHQWSARLVRTEASLDAQSRMLYAVAELPAPFDTQRHGAPLLMGSFVSAAIEGRELTDIVSLPINAVFQRDRLYSVNDEGQVVEKQVRVLTIDGERIWVKGDLRDGEPVIIDRQGYVSPGVAVRIAGEDEDTPEPEDDEDAPAEPAPEGEDAV